MDAVGFVYHENPPTWAGLKPANFGEQSELGVLDHFFKNNLKEELFNKNFQKSWCNNIQNISVWLRKKAVAEFHLAMGHECLARLLHLIKVLNDPQCVLCNLREPIDCTHL
ncbi:hypothetical protein TNCV_2121531 [Trichonephila clavipes]|nr:hypothetical protein TNCV_2121531 [Trichonephila clavipes]